MFNIMQLFSLTNSILMLTSSYRNTVAVAYCIRYILIKILLTSMLLHSNYVYYVVYTFCGTLTFTIILMITILCM